jgi:hypothetical protein
MVIVVGAAEVSGVGLAITTPGSGSGSGAITAASRRPASQAS